MGNSDVANRGGQVGIVIPVYRGRTYVGEALDSVREQTYSGARRTIVVEDGSPSGEASRDVVEQHPEVLYEAYADNRGVFYARWFGSTLLPPVQYLAFLDQDDVWHPDFLARTVDALEAHPKAVMAVTNARMKDPGGDYQLYRMGTPSITLDALKWQNPIISPSQVLIRRAAWQDAALTPELAAPGADDWLIWLALLARGHDGVYVPDVLVDYREHAAGAHNVVNMRKSEREVVQQWYPRFGLSRWDQRCYHGRVALETFDRALHRRSVSGAVKGFAAGARDPRAFWAAVRERRRRRRLGVV